MSAFPLPRAAFPSTDDVGETILQFLIRTLLHGLVTRWLAERGEPAFVGSDQFVYWDPQDPRKSLAPDLFVLPGVDRHRDVRSWQVWAEGGVVPSLAVEVVSSDDIAKDYDVGPRRYAELGVRELVIFDPEPSGKRRVRWQVYRRQGQGPLLLAVREASDRVWSEVLGCFLREVAGDDGMPRIRLATAAAGEALVPTVEESERAQKHAAEAEVLRLRLELERLRRG